ncbi:MAG: hypothetical protein HYY06_07765 [Deltaproteobacteria bacterium]|nr:hypothetical protein [Deltaproteobacteria bacterium]
MVKVLPALATALLAGCVDCGGAPQTGVFGQLTAGPGAIFLEEGPVQQGEFKRFGVIGEDGRFRVSLPSAGTWGVHLYVEGYFYLPLQLEVREDFFTRIEQPAIDWSIVRNGPSWGSSGEQPVDPRILAAIPDDDPSDNPVLTNPTVQMIAAGRFEASVEVLDPNGDLSRQVLLGQEETGDGVQFNTPQGLPVIEDNYPNGTYTVTRMPEEVADPHGAWYFVAADHLCSNSPILRVVP